MSRPFRYLACGIAFESDLELPGVPLAPGAAASSVRVRFGDVPSSLPQAVECKGAFEAAPDHLLLTVAEVGKFLVRFGKEIVIEPDPSATANDLRAYLLGS